MRRLAIAVLQIAALASVLQIAAISTANAGEFSPSLVPVDPFAQAQATKQTARPSTWPLAIEASALIGVEPHQAGTPIAFGVVGELLWKARAGGFFGLLSSEGSPVLVSQVVNGKTLASLADRISIPFGVASRPLAFIVGDRASFAARLAHGLDVQLGLTVEHLRTSDDNTTTAGLHLAVALDVPLWGGPMQGGGAVRLMGRGVFTPAVSLSSGAVQEPIASGQFYAGFVYFP